MIKIKQKLWKITAILSVCLLLAGCAQETPDRAGSSKTSEEKMDVSVEIRCDTAIKKGLTKQKKWKGVLPKDGCMLKKEKMQVKKGSSVFDLLCEVQDAKGIQIPAAKRQPIFRESATCMNRTVDVGAVGCTV